MYEEFVTSHGLEFYPLGGDPKILSGWMVKSRGRLMPNLLDQEEMLVDLPAKQAMLKEITHSTWGAVSDMEGYGENPPFIAHAVISNPVTYGHIHVAEALGVPLHLMFPQPWSPTESFPHPLSGLPNDQPGKAAWLSYHGVDQFMWTGLGRMINEFRSEKLGLRPLLSGNMGGHLLNARSVPFAKLWSPALVPKPQDWGHHIDITGSVFLDLAAPPTPSSLLDAGGFKAPPELLSWLEEGPAPVFIGFGSMVIEDTSSLLGRLPPLES